MNNEQIFDWKKIKIRNLILVGIIMAALSFLLVIFTQKTFKATADAMIVQNQQDFSDYYALYKSSEYSSKILMESIYSERFLDEVSNTRMISLAEFLPEKRIDRLEAWKNMVKVRQGTDSGIINITVLGNSQRQVSKIADAITNVLVNKNDQFLGGGKKLDVKIISGPLVGQRIGFFEVVLIVLAGFMMGVLLTIIFSYYWNLRQTIASKNDDQVASSSSEVYRQ